PPLSLHDVLPISVLIQVRFVPCWLAPQVLRPNHHLPYLACPGRGRGISPCFRQDPTAVARKAKRQMLSHLACGNARNGQSPVQKTVALMPRLRRPPRPAEARQRLPIPCVPRPSTHHGYPKPPESARKSQVRRKE